MPFLAQRSPFCKHFPFIFTIFILTAASVTVGAAEKLRVSNCYIGGAIMPLWVTQESGLFQREGLDVELITIQGQPAVAALIAGDVDLLYCIPHAVISAAAGGADLMFVGSIYNRMQYRIVAAPG